jgi:hypothetical protein
LFGTHPQRETKPHRGPPGKPLKKLQLPKIGSSHHQESLLNGMHAVDVYHMRSNRAMMAQPTLHLQALLSRKLVTPPLKLNFS